MAIVCGIYRITNTTNGRSYLGSSKNVSKRWKQHIGDLRRGNHDNSNLQAAWNKSGESVFSFEVVELLAESELQTRETYWIQATLPSNYNIKIRGWTHRPETCAKISASHLGKKHRPYTEEEKLAQSLRLKGKPKTLEHRLHMSDSRRGKDFLSPDAHKRQALSLSRAIRGEDNPNFGNRWTEKQRQKMSKTLETLKYNFVCDRCNQTFTAVTRSSYGGHRRKCLRYSNPQSPCLLP